MEIQMDHTLSTESMIPLTLLDIIHSYFHDHVTLLMWWHRQNLNKSLELQTSLFSKALLDKVSNQLTFLIRSKSVARYIKLSATL